MGDEVTCKAPLLLFWLIRKNMIIKTTNASKTGTKINSSFFIELFDYQYTKKLDF
jgi:hypothetical protein